MRNNHQVLVLNGEEKTFTDFKTKQIITDWVFAFDIESAFKNKFTYHGQDCFIWAVYDCCRSVLKEHDALISAEITEIQEAYAEEQKKKRGDATGPKVAALNHLFVYGCQANSTVFDDNLLVQNIATEFRLHQRNKSLLFPLCLMDLSKRFTDCVIASAALCDVYVPYEDEALALLNIEPDQLDIIIEARKQLIVPIPKGFSITDL